MSQEIESKIISIKGQCVILDNELARLYGVSTTRLNQLVNRNIDRFPKDFMFQLPIQEVKDLMLQNAISKIRHGGRRKPVKVFTEFGDVMATTVLNSKIAIDASILLVRVFIRMREVMLEHADLRKQLQFLEQQVAKGFSEHAEELREIRFVLAKLEHEPEIKRGQLVLEGNSYKVNCSRC